MRERYAKQIQVRATVKHGIRKPETEIWNRKPESGIRNPDIMNDNRNNSLQQINV